MWKSIVGHGASTRELTRSIVHAQVGSGAIGLARGTIIAGVMDWIGAVSLGSGVSSKVSKSVSEITDEDCWACGYCDSRMTVYGIGMVGALVGASGFLLLATFASMPVSTTHAIVGCIVGMTMAGTNASCVDWSYEGVGGIIPRDATLIYSLELRSLEPFAPTEEQKAWFANHPNPWDAP